MTPSDLRDAGQALYGLHWHSQIAADLGVTARTVQRWDTGERRIPSDLQAKLSALIQARIRKLERLVA